MVGMNDEIINKDDYNFEMNKIEEKFNWIKKFLLIIYGGYSIIVLLDGLGEYDNLEEFLWPIKFVCYLMFICFIMLVWFFGIKLIKNFFNDLISYYKKEFFKKKRSFYIKVGIYYFLFSIHLGLLFFSLFGLKYLIRLL